MNLMNLLTSSATSYIDSDILADIGTLLNQITTWITGNVYLAIFFTLSLVAVGIGVFKSLRRVLRG